MKPKPSGAQQRKREKEKELMEIDFDLMMSSAETKRNLKALKENFKELSTLSKITNQDLRNLRAYRDGGYNVTGIQSANEKKASKSARKKAEIQSKYSPENYSDKKSMYLDISIKENISIHTAIKYFRK